jgi:predicted AAA+ superfamily ATPase
MNKEALKYVLSQFTSRELPSVRARDLEVPLESGKVVGLVGVRRSGKTFLMFDMIRRLTEAGVDRRQVLYLNFEDDRLYPVAAPELDLILTAHAELYPDAAAQPRYVFLDEVQDVPGWERYVRRVYDTEQVHLFVSGSSSKVLTRDLAPAMRGRSLSFEVFPLSFAEYLRFCGITYEPYNRDDEARLAHALEQYLAWGGLPELVLADKALRPLILDEYAALLFFRGNRSVGSRAHADPHALGLARR